jgi:TATA-box binding protein (TBP) (component of TFIID and TFIIIB)
MMIFDLFCRLKDYKTPYGATCLIFRSGKVVIVGAKSEKQINDSENLLSKLLDQFLI